MEIFRNRVTIYNDRTTNIVASRNVNAGKATSGMRNMAGYTAAIETASIDLSLAVLDPNPRYRIAIWYDLKDDVLPYGLNLFNFPGELTTVEQFTKWLQDILLKGAQPTYNLGLFELNSEDFFTYSIPQQAYDDAFASGIFRVYFNQPLCRILEGFYSETVEEFDDELFYQLSVQPGTKTATIDTMWRLNKIENIMFTTSLPITETQILALTQNDLLSLPIFGSILVNALSYNIRTKPDYQFIPNLLRYYSLQMQGPINSYEISVWISYNDGQLRLHQLAPSERVNVNLVFQPPGVEH